MEYWDSAAKEAVPLKQKPPSQIDFEHPQQARNLQSTELPPETPPPRMMPFCQLIDTHRATRDTATANATARA